MPYILRRLKTDRSVISDLPEKVEMKTYAALSKKQVVLYQNLIAEVEGDIEDADGILKTMKGCIECSWSADMEEEVEHQPGSVDAWSG